MTKVIFRKHKDYKKLAGDGIVAFFPGEEVAYDRILCYEHCGQHNEASYSYYLENTVKAKPEEYASLLNELINIVGYDDLKIMQKVMHSTISDSWRRCYKHSNEINI